MPIYEQHFDGTPGTTITNVTTAQPGNTALVSANTSGLTITYSSEQKMHGSTSMKVTTPGSGTSSGVAVLRPAGTPGLRAFSWRAYVYLTSLPSNATNIVFMQSVSAQMNLSLLNVGSNGTVGYTISTGGGQSISAGTFTIGLNHWYRFEGSVVLDQTNGSMLLRVFDGDATTPIATLNPTGIATTESASNGLQQLHFGKGTSSPTIGSFFIDDIAMGDSTTAVGPYVPGAPGVIADSSVNGTTGSLSSVASTYDNVAPSYAWVQTAGPTVTLSSTTVAAPTVPLTTAGSYSFKVTITDDLGRTASDTTTLTYAGATTAPAVSGTTLSSPRWVEIVTGTPVAAGTMSYVITPSTGVTQLAPGVFTGATPNIATTYQVTATESGNANTTVFRFTIAGSPTATGGLRILVASDDAASGGSFS